MSSLKANNSNCKQTAALWSLTAITACAGALTIYSFEQTLLAVTHHNLQSSFTAAVLLVFGLWSAYQARCSLCDVQAQAEFWLDVNGRKYVPTTAPAGWRPPRQMTSEVITNLYRRVNAPGPWMWRLLYATNWVLGTISWALIVNVLAKQGMMLMVYFMVCSYVGGVVFTLVLQSPMLELVPDIRPKADAEEHAERALSHFEDLVSRGAAPRIDLMLLCCKEAFDVIQDTVLASLLQDYPADRYVVHVLDDGNDDTLREWVESLDEANTGRVTYIRRKKVPGKPHHYKAGNMNHALDLTCAPYVAQLDADMIPTPRFLKRLMAELLAEPRAAFTYCPQSFYNWGAMDVMDDHQVTNYFLPSSHLGLNFLKVAPNGGSGVMWKRTALDEMGGFRVESLGEDYLTSFDIISKGYTSVYCRELMQTGLVPWTPEAWLAQHHRWCIGSLEQFALLSRQILKSPHLKFIQKYALLCCVMPFRYTFLLSWCLGLLSSCVMLFFVVKYDSFMLLKDCFELRCMAYLSAVGGVIGLLGRMMPFSDFPWPWAWVLSVREGMYVEKPYAIWWTLCWIFGFDGGWKATGSLCNSSQGNGGILMELKKFARKLWFVGYDLLFWAVGMTITSLVVARYWQCSHPFWWSVRMCMLASGLVGLPAMLLPVWYYTHAMPKPQDRKDMVPRDKLTGVPTIDPANVWPKVHAGVLAVQSLAPITRLLLTIALCGVSYMYPPSYSERLFCPAGAQPVFWH